MIRFVQQLHTPPHQVVYWVGHAHAASDAVRALPDVPFHPHDLAERADPAPGINAEDFPPPGVGLINSLCKTESLVLTMLNRFTDTLCVDERRHLYYHMLSYWSGILDRYKPDAIIFAVEPHWVFDYLVFELAKQLGIKTFLFNETKVSDRMLWMEDFWDGSTALHAAQARNAGKNFSLSDVSDDIVSYYQPRASKDFDAVPGHIDFLKKKHSWRYRWSHDPRVLQSFKDGSFLFRAPRFAFRLWQNERMRLFIHPWRGIKHLFGSTLKKEYAALTKPPDWSKKFVYLALQVQPERTTSPLGGVFCDQVLLTEIVSAALPKDWVIYVKEHPIQWLRIGVEYSSNRYKGYYKKLAAIPNVQLVPVETSTYELNNRSQAVVTVTGTPGWEALLRSKPAIIFGYPWYKDCPGLLRVDSIESCREAFRAILNGYRVDQQLIINYLKSLDESTIHGYIAPSNARASKLNQDESFRTIAECIRKELDNKRDPL